MADVKVPIRFEIYKGDSLIREEVLEQDVIKIRTNFIPEMLKSAEDI